MVKWFWLVAYVFIIVFTTPHNFQDKYYLAEKEALEKFRKKYKEKYDTKAETFKKEVNWSIKRKKKKKKQEKGTPQVLCKSMEWFLYDRDLPHERAVTLH